MDEERPASEEYAAVIDVVLHGGESPDRRREAIDREIELIYESLRDYLAAENEAALQRARREAAFKLKKDGTMGERGDAMVEYDAAQEAEKNAEADAAKLREGHGEDFFRLKVLEHIREFIQAPPDA